MEVRCQCTAAATSRISLDALGFLSIALVFKKLQNTFEFC